MRIRRMACEHCGARAWVDGHCLRCGKPARDATETPPDAEQRTAPSLVLFSRPAVVMLAILTVLGMLALVVPMLLGLVTPRPIALFILIMFGFIVLAKLRPKRR